MANPAQPCNCSPYENICCCGPENGISVTQPKCQTLPDGSVVTNPAFVANFNKSFWTYKFLTDCGDSETKAISNFGIPICQTILAGHIIVSEKIDGCGEFVSVPFELIVNDPNFGPAPTGFQWLKVNPSERFEKGVCVAYRIEITGDYPIANEPIKVKAGMPVLTFDCGCFQVPECNPEGKLFVDKTCGATIVDNQITLNYVVDVDNIGDGALTDVQFEDIIFYPTQLTLGPITTDPPPPTLTVNTTVPGKIVISGNIGDFDPGEDKIITYEIKIASVTEPGSYTINNTATATATGTQDSATCATTVNVVKLRADKCCRIDGNQGLYTISIASLGNSPEITVDIMDHLEIPTGITVRFTSFGGCDAFFSGLTDPVPLNQDLMGPFDVNIKCLNHTIPSAGTLFKTISYELVCSEVVGTVTITNTLSSVSPVDPTAQVFLGTENIPVFATIDVTLSQVCNKPCLIDQLI